MDCEKICEQICSYLDNEMEQQTRKSFEEHIATCEKCSKEIETCRCIKSRIRKGLQSVKAPEFLKKKILFNLQNSDNYRESGIDALDLIQWGSHIAQLCSSKYDLTELLIPYMKNGLQHNERCLWVISDMSVSEAKIAIIENFPDSEKCLDKGQLEIISYEDWYLFNGHFDGQAILDLSLEKYKNAIYSGYSGFRFAGNACWTDGDYFDDFIDLEERINKLLSDEKILILCSFKYDKCTKDRISDVENNHKYVLVKSNGSWKLKRLCQQED